jgi:DMSO reductase family type II enzyme chaperone
MESTEPMTRRDLAGARQAVYRFLLAAFGRPTPGQHAWLTGPGFRPALATACGAFDLPVPGGELFPADCADLESRYLACFEVGLPGPPVPLLASHYNTREPVPRTIHEHILFYRLFGFHPAAGGEPADHLLNELGFLVRLDELLTAGRADAGSVLRARRDFLARHAARWPARAAPEADEKGLPPVYRALLALLAAAVRQDRELTEADLADLEESKHEHAPVP